MEKDFWLEYKKEMRICERKKHDEELRAINHFEKVIRGEITLDDFVKVRGGYGLKTTVNMPTGEISYDDPKQHDYINGLMDMAINNHAKYCYIKFLSDISKPYIKEQDLYNKDARLHNKYIFSKYGLFVYFLSDGKMYKFIFAPSIESCESNYWMTYFKLIDLDRDYNFIRIDKPKIKKDPKNRKRMPTKFLLKKLSNGGYASVPDYGADDKMN